MEARRAQIERRQVVFPDPFSPTIATVLRPSHAGGGGGLISGLRPSGPAAPSLESVFPSAGPDNRQTRAGSPLPRWGSPRSPLSAVRYAFPATLMHGFFLEQPGSTRIGPRNGRLLMLDLVVNLLPARLLAFIVGPLPAGDLLLFVQTGRTGLYIRAVAGSLDRVTAFVFFLICSRWTMTFAVLSSSVSS